MKAMPHIRIERLSNKELSIELDKAQKYLIDAIDAMQVDENSKEAAVLYANLIKEASKRLANPPHITFEDESF